MGGIKLRGRMIMFEMSILKKGNINKTAKSKKNRSPTKGHRRFAHQKRGAKRDA